MMKILIFLALTLTVATFAVNTACARSLRDIGGAIVYPGKKIVKNANHNAKHVAGDPNRRRHSRVGKSHHHRRH